MKTVPKNTYNAIFILKKSGLTIENIKAESFESSELIEIHFTHDTFKIIISTKRNEIKKGRGKFNVQISLTDSNDVTKLKNITYFFTKLYRNDDLIIENTTLKTKFDFPLLAAKEFKNNLRKEFELLYNIYNSIFIIQNHFNITFKLPKSFSHSDYDDLVLLSNTITNKRHKISSSHQFNITAKKHPKLREIITKSISPFILNINSEILIKLFNYEFTIILKCIKCINAYLSNKEDAIKQINNNSELVKLTIKSKSNFIQYKYKEILIKKLDKN